MIKGLLYCLLFVAFFSCSAKNKVPAEIIQPHEMKEILWDVMNAQNLALTTGRDDSLVTEVTTTKALSQKVFEIHKITSLEFDRSYNWYLRNPQVMKVMLDSLYSQKQRENSLEIERRNLPDSLKKKDTVI